MILVTVGTTDFDELVARMDDLAGDLDEEIVAQIGRGAYVPRNMEWFRFAPSLDPHYDRARLVVAHGGQGTVAEVLERGLPLVALSNADRFDLHQEDLLGAMERRGHLLWCRSLAELPEALERAAAHTFTPYQPSESRIAQVIRQHLGLDDDPSGH